MICTLWTPFQKKIHTERFFKFPSNIYSILNGYISFIFDNFLWNLGKQSDRHKNFNFKSFVLTHSKVTVDNLIFKIKFNILFQYLREQTTIYWSKNLSKMVSLFPVIFTDKEDLWRIKLNFFTFLHFYWKIHRSHRPSQPKFVDKTCRAQNLRYGIVLKTSFRTRVSRMGLDSFVDINICVMKYYFI